MKFGSLFSGIGGIDLGLERAGMTCIWQSEIEPYACQVLAKHWPDIPNLGDIRDIDWTAVERADVVAGGYPCQPFSLAGRRAGEDDPRHLWPMFADCIRVVRPRYALLENVAGHLGLGFGSVLSDLAALGYDARWDCIPAAAVGAPHLRDRVFVIARDTRAERRRLMADSNNRRSLDPLRTRWNAPWNGGPAVAYAGRIASQVPPAGRHPSIKEPKRACGWETEPSVGRVAHGIPRRMDRLRALGNAVVPQVAEHIGNIIMEADNDRQI